ncbi:hypothetical protein FRB94_010550 [Tulasnella sp. JGI-2019a]|nr:hypothetical protein FRB94_010550 [Tulasnella sp. JGI-2019a]KAG9039079.1 hypothetical protein FRB95_012790 [Tulasnella sp. JGI-2019a]
MIRSIKHTYGSKSRTRSQPGSSSSIAESPKVNGAETSSPNAGSSSCLKRKQRNNDEEEEEDRDSQAIPSLYSSPLFSIAKKRRTTSLLFPSKAKSKKENRPASLSSSSALRSSSPIPSSSSSAPPLKSRPLTQLHLSFTTSIRTCSLCQLSYTRGAPDDERLHKSHCTRVTRGMEWGREEEKAGQVQVVETNVKTRQGRTGRIISFKADVKGKIGSKLSTLLQTIDLALSSPPIPPETLANSKIYLFLLPNPSSVTREKIVGCVVATRIKTAMRVVHQDKDESEESRRLSREDLVRVDGEEGGLYCDPKPLPTPLGIPRLFVPSEHRQQGIAQALLSSAAKTFVFGCPLDPKKGEVAFSQPTSSGRAVMMRWGGGGIRIFEE